MSSTRFLTLAPRHMPVLLVLVCLLIITGASHNSQADACASCMNGGKLLMPNNIFGFCRCKCPNMYKGPRCQFAKKKRTSLSPLGLGWGGQLYEPGSADDDTDAVIRDTMRVPDEAMLKLILQQLYSSSQQIPYATEDRR